MAVVKANKFSESNPQVIYQSSLRPYGVTVYHAARQPFGKTISKIMKGGLETMLPKIGKNCETFILL